METEKERPTSKSSRVARPLAQALLLCVVAMSAGAQTRAIVHCTPAEYPILAEKMRIGGTVTVVASIDPPGSVVGARATAGHTMLRPAAEEAVLQWKFASAPRQADTTVDIIFQLPGEDTR